MTQALLIKRLQRGWLSSAQAFSEFGTLKLTSRISDLRKTNWLLMSIKQRSVKVNGKTFCEYRML
jgi:hypothetical protein